MSALTLEMIVHDTTDLPTLPQAAIMVMRETNNPECSAASVARHLANDLSLSARVLRLANSAFYGMSRQVASIQESVIILGMRTVRNLALVASTFPWMKKELTGYEMGPMDLWRHAAATALASKLIAKKQSDADVELAYCCGLLHDLGKTALSAWLEGRGHEAAALAEAEGISFHEAENRLLGFDHTQVGAQLAGQWNLPDVYKFVMLYHHNPDSAWLEDGPKESVIDCVHVGEHMARLAGLGHGVDAHHYPLSSNSLERLGLKQEDLDLLLEEFRPLFEEQDRQLEEMLA